MALSRLCCRTSSLFTTKPLAVADLPRRAPSSSLAPSLLRRAHQGFFSDDSAAAAPCRLWSLRQLPRQLPSRGFAAGAGSASPAASSVQEAKTGEVGTAASSSTDSDHKPAAEWRRERGGLRRRRNRGRRDLVAFSGGIGNALWQATETVNRLLRSLSPWQLFRRVREDDNAYRLQLEVPGMSREDLRVTVQGNYLVVTGEKKAEESREEEEEEEEGDQYWASSSRSYGYCNTWCLLPEDAKVDEIKAEVKHGMLYVTIPRAEQKKADVVEVEVH